MKMSIEAKGVSVRYGRETVLEIPRLDVKGPGLAVVTGPNGAGKSTFLRLCAGLQRPEDGTVEVNGVKAHRRRARLSCGYSPDHPVLFDDLSVTDNVTYAYQSSGAESSTEVADDLIDAFGLTDLLKRYPSQLSRGQRQAASLVVAAARPLDIMLFDEPTLALDDANRSHLSEVLSSHMRDHMFLVASHDSGLIASASRNIRISQGHLG